MNKVNRDKLGITIAAPGRGSGTWTNLDGGLKWDGMKLKSYIKPMD